MLASGSEMSDAMRIANRAAGIVVGKLGTAVVSREEIEQDIKFTG
jgi:bifunctional ADP-heptose synthase (sugar kinase/adenylyltransferase)